MKQRFFHLKERAQSLTELAISFTFLMLLLAGSVDLARAFFFYLTLADASQEGAVYAAMNPTDTAGIEARVRGAADTPLDLATDPDVTVMAPVYSDAAHQCAGVDATSGDAYTVTIEVRYQYHFTMPLISGMFPTLTLSASTTNTILRPAC